MEPPFAWYREFAPCEALRDDVYALFSFVPAPARTIAPRPLLREIGFSTPILCAPQFADGHTSIVFDVGRTCDAEGRWRADSRAVCGTVVGPLTRVGRTEVCDLPETVGAYLRPGRVDRVFDVATPELTDSAVAIEDLWGAGASELPHELCELSEAARIERLEFALLAHVGRSRPRRSTLDVQGLAAHVLRTRGAITVDAMARAAGVSRQHLSREFRERIGIGPKRYSRLARFHSVLRYAGSRANIEWANVALDLGFADQSHMIAEVRQFSGLTPQALADRGWFHPFIERAKTATRPARRSVNRSLSGAY